MKPFSESHHRRPIHYSGPPQDSRPFYKRSRDLPSKAVLRVQGRRPQCSSRQCKSPPVTVFLLKCRPVVAQCKSRLQHFNSAAVQTFNVAVPFPSGACGSLGCHSVASPPRGRPWRLSPLVVQIIISMIVWMILFVSFINANGGSFACFHYVLVILLISLYRILMLIWFPRFAEIF